MEIIQLLMISTAIIAVMTTYRMQEEKNSDGENPLILKVKVFIPLSASVLFIAGFYLLLRLEIPTVFIGKLLGLLGILMIASYHDYRSHRIPNTLILFALGLRFILYLIELLLYPEFIMEIFLGDLVGMIFAGGIFLIAGLISKGSIGMGDIKILGIMGLYQGFSGVIGSIFFTLLFTFFLSLALLLIKKKKRKSTIPFAPSMLVGTFLAILLSGM